MVHKIDMVGPIKERSFSHITYFYTPNKVGVKVGIQFFRIGKSPLGRAKIEDLVKAIENNEVSNINDLYGYMNKGYVMNLTTQDKFKQYAEGGQ